MLESMAIGLSVVLLVGVIVLAKEVSSAQKRIQGLLEEISNKNVLMERSAQAMESAKSKHEELLYSLKRSSEDYTVLEKALEFQQSQYEKLLGQKKSSEVRTGKITEQISPFLKDYPLDPNTARFIGDPIDFVHFDNEKVTFVEVKSGKSQLSKKQKHIQNLIKSGQVDFIIYRVEGKDEPDQD